ncbi:protein of unknown function DUF1311 [Ancylobacter novellus DSM 506]|uniref:Lysozyme inhibitor LprI-like N-terminal domain-containing protein n=1 Tax=Ancylobacter novellus (strain ATCC 8093 / DSM 506 / JCM 20403 / CCM 1077 / IAM 12100 / NBRC 12443 / NCIMB 10456) TaxID=639283 RepID=D7A4S2_ANCN5|nr:lysozyme inhibitor LprI family protein [Ancylobacter novellus]ADH87970.1 protein of unknown function DUF1311 [Ancylobacter novellus DSM 506]
MSGHLSRLCCLAAAAMLAWAAPRPVWAQWNPQTNCDKLDGYAMEDCLTKEAAEADKALNAAYQKMLAAIDQDATPSDPKATWRDNLVAAQRAWIAYRDANCKFDLSVRNGISAAAPRPRSSNACWR